MPHQSLPCTTHRICALAALRGFASTPNDSSDPIDPDAESRPPVDTAAASHQGPSSLDGNPAPESPASLETDASRLQPTPRDTAFTALAEGAVRAEHGSHQAAHEAQELAELQRELQAATMDTEAFDKELQQMKQGAHHKRKPGIAAFMYTCLPYIRSLVFWSGCICITVSWACA